jgi:lysozyme family protein
MNSFDEAFEQTLGLEGGYSDDPADRGGRTKYGITEATFREALSQGVIAGVDNIRDLTVAQAKAIYKIRYWTPLRLDEVGDPAIAAEIFDTAVNSGPGRAALIAQLALRFLGEAIVADGAMGPATIGAINKWCAKDPRAFMVCLNGFQFLHYVAIVDAGLITEITRRVKSDASQGRFSRGWTKRIQEYRNL